MLQEIREGKFDPDATRSGRRGVFLPIMERLEKPLDDAEGDYREELEEAMADDSDFEGAPHGGECDDGDIELPVIVEPLVVEVQRKIVEYADFSEAGDLVDDTGYTLWSNDLYGTLHREKKYAHERLLCGTEKAKASKLTEWHGHWAGMVCDRCFPLPK